MNKKVKKAVPALRFPEFTGEWEKIRLEKLANWSSGGTPSKENAEYWNGDIPWISASSMYEDLLVDSDHKITQLGLKNGSKLACKNSILILVRGSILYNRIPIGIAGIEVAFNQDVKALEILNNREVFFLFYWLKSQEHFLKSIVSGTGIGAGKLDTSQLKALIVFKPSVEEQQKIAQFLSLVDEKLNALRRKREYLETYKRGVMQQIFTQKIRFQDDDGSDFPDWEEKTMGNLFKWITTNSLSRENLNYDSGTVKNIHYGDIHRKFKPLFILKNEEVPYVSDESFVSNLDDESFCQIGDLVIADASEDYADIGKAIEIIEVEPRELIAGLHCFIARPKKDNVALGFSGYLFQSEKVQNQIRRIAQGISVLGISKTNLSKILLPYPCLKEQQKIAEFLTAIDRKIEAVSQQIDRMEQFKKGLLQKMFV